MNENEAHHSDMEDDIIEIVSNTHNLVRPSFRWIVTLTDLANEVDEATESDPLSNASQSERFVINSVKRKLGNEHSDSQSTCLVDDGAIKRPCLQIPAPTTSTENNDSCNTEIAEGPWCTLPQPILVQIILHLDNKNRLNMALTCKPWSKLIGSACLWRSLNLELSSFQTIGKSMVLYAKSHARHFNRVVVTWRRPSYILSSSIHNGLNKIFTQLKIHSQLRVFRMHYMELDRYWRYEKRREKLLNSIVKFLNVQKKLKTFVMNSAQTEMTHGCRILESAAKNSGSIIETLNIEDFFQSRVAAFSVPQYINAISKFTNIKYLYLNYNYISDEIAGQLAVNSGLHILSIKVYKNDPHYHRISSTTWAKLRKASPKLEVNFEFDQVPSYREIVPILVSQVPLRGLYIWSGYEDEDEWMLCDTFNYVSKNFYKTLESFTLEIENYKETIDVSLVQLVRTCKTLYYLDINAVVSPTTVDEICKLQEEGKISLQSMYITITGAPDSETQVRLDEITARYAGLTDAYHLDFQFTADVIVPSVDEDNNVHVIPEEQ